MKRFQIYFWHGFNKKLALKIEDICCDMVGDTYFYTGTLDKFAEEYGDKFIFMPETSERQAMICVTQYNSWGAR